MNFVITFSFNQNLMQHKTRAFIAAFLAALIYGVSFTIAKDVMPFYIKPYGFIVLRVVGAALLFWGISIFAVKEKIDPQDFVRIVLAAVFGIALNMLTFFKGLSMTTPISASVIMVTTPIIVLILSALILKERITSIKVFGIFIGLAGAVLLISYGRSLQPGENPALGNLLVFVNAASYSLYLIIVKKLTDKYNPFTFIKWLYLFGAVLVIPFGAGELQEVQWQQIPITIYYKIGYIVVFTTFFAYLLNIFALTKLKPTTLSSFIYLQPLLASLYALFVGSDSLDAIKVVATILIFTGVYLVTKSNAGKMQKIAD